MPSPRRILILGPSGAGKSTLARGIGAALAIPVVHLDHLFWQLGWVESDETTFRARIAEAAAGEAWVMDGNYSRTLDLRLPRAGTVIWLDLPRHVYFPSAVWRSIRNYGRTRSDIGPDCREQFNIAFFRDWVWTYKHRARDRQARFMAELPAGIRGIVLTSRREVNRFVARLPGALDEAEAGRCDMG